MEKLRQTFPGFHGDRVRLAFNDTGSANFAICSEIKPGPYKQIGAASVYLPLSQAAALREACDAFNAVMDRHEAALAVPVRTGHLLGEVAA